MNATRAVTVSSRAAAPRPRTPRPAHPPRRGQRAHSDSPLYSIGRVQTPTLAILVRRELAIRAVPAARLLGGARRVRACRDAAEAAEKVTATWGVALPDGKAIRSRLGERALADGVVARGESAASGPPGQGPVVERLRQKRVREPPPLLFDLTSLQRTANRRYGLSATATLAAAQALYERHKILTYPRTDSRHLTSDMGKELPKLFGALAALPEYAPFAAPLLETPPARSRRVFDDGKVNDHHAIVPTGKPVNLDELPRDERRIFDLVARRFLGAFHPDAEFALTDVVIRVGPPEAAARAAAEPRGRRRGRTAGRRGVRDDAAAAARSLPRARSGAARRGLAGGRPVRRDPRTATGGATLPPLAEGQRLDGKLEVMTKQTRPPPRHTEATLLGAMESAGRDITDEEAARRHARFGPRHARHARRDDRDADPANLRRARRQEPRADGDGHRPHRRPAGEEPGLARADRELGGAPVAHGARPGDARRVHGRHLALRERRRHRDPRRGGRRAGAGRGGAAARERRARSPRRRPAKPKPPKAKPVAKDAPPPSTLTCPRCKQGTLVAGKRGWGCTRWREGCAFVIWFEIAGRRITDAELADLVSKGKTRKRKWRSGEGAEIGGRLVLDLSATRDAGAARLDARGE